MEEIEQTGTAAADIAAAGETANTTGAEQTEQVGQASQDQAPIDPSKNGEAGKPIDANAPPPSTEDAGTANLPDAIPTGVPEEAHSLVAEIEAKLHHLDLLPSQTAEFFKGKFSALSKIIKAL